MRWRLLAGVAAGVLALAGCGGAKSSVAPPSSAASTATSAMQKLQRQVDSLQLLVSILQTQTDGLVKHANALDTDKVSVDMPAGVGTDSPGYGVGHTQFGPFLASVKTLTPYLDGYKVDLQVMTLAATVFAGAHVHIQWGPLLQSKTTARVTNLFLPGQWTPLQVVLAPAKPADVRMLTVGLTFNVVR